MRSAEIAARDATRAAPGDVPRALVVVVLLVLMMLHAAPYGWSTIINDTARDLAQAVMIVDGDVLPLRGPIINAMFHLGPAWFYLLAACLALTQSIAGTLVAVGVIAALKFPLAYACGRRLGGAALGLAWACALAWPGWSSVQQILVSHWNMIEVTLLAATFALLALAQGGRARWWLAYGLAQGLAIHAHPATIALAVVLPVVLWCRRASWRRDIGAIVAGVVVAVLPLVPMLVAEAREGWPALDRVGEYASERGAQSWLGGFVTLMRALTVGGWQLVADDLVSGDARPVLWVALIVVAVAGVAGVIIATRDARARRTLLLATGVALAMLAAIQLLRTSTPFYMGMVALPPLALVVAALLSPLADGTRVARGGFAAALGAIVLLSAINAVTLVRRADQGLVQLPTSSILDLHNARRTEPVALLPAAQVDALGREICASPRRIVLHGHLALLGDSALSLGSRIRCDDRARVGIGGGAAIVEADHRLGLTPRAWSQLGEPGRGWREARARAPARVLAADETNAVADGRAYPLRPRDAGEPRDIDTRFRTRGDARVMVSHPFYAYDGQHTREVVVDGRAADVVLATAGVDVYACNHCAAGSDVEWRIVVRTGYPSHLDIVELPPRSAVAAAR